MATVMEKSQPGSQFIHMVLGPGCAGKHAAPGCNVGRIAAGALVWVTHMNSAISSTKGWCVARRVGHLSGLEESVLVALPKERQQMDGEEGNRDGLRQEE